MSFAANFMLSVTVKEFKKLVNIWRRYEQQVGCFYFYFYDKHATQLPTVGFEPWSSHTAVRHVTARPL